MSINFFESSCQELPINNALFGLCDDKNSTKAYTNIDEPSKWIANVKNDKKINLLFTAIDNCIIKNHEYQGRGRCDGMITSINHIYFVELKNQDKGWKSDAIEQLESTIKFFIANHNIQIFTHKKAYICNKSHRHFQVTDNEMNKRFFEKYKVRIHVSAEIVI